MIAELPKHHCWHCYMGSEKGNWDRFTQETKPNATHYDASFVEECGLDPECNWYCEKHWQAIQKYKATHKTFNEASQELHDALFQPLSRLIEPLLTPRGVIIIGIAFIALLVLGFLYGR